MSDFPTNFSPFLWTEFQSKAKPLALSIADSILAQGRIFSRLYYVEINSDGHPREKGVRETQDKGWVVMAISCGLVGTMLASEKFHIAITPASYIAFSFATKVISYEIIKLDDSLSKINNKLVQWILRIINLIALMALFCVGGISLLFSCYGIYSFPLAGTSLALGCFAANLLLGTGIKYFVWKTYPEIQQAYENFFPLLKVRNSQVEMPPLIGDSRQMGDVKHKLAERIVEMKQSEEGVLFSLSLDMLIEILSYLSLTDHIQLLSCNIFLKTSFSQQDILVQKIYQSFSLSFVDSLGLNQILQVLEQDRLTNDLFPNLENPRPTFDVLIEGPRMLKFPERDALEFCMKDHVIAWGKTSKNKLFLCFKVKEEFFRNNYFLVANHHSEWETSSLRMVQSCSNEPYQIYKVNEEHYSDVPSKRNPYKTNFFELLQQLRPINP